jgi:preprotein translocase subunit SecG
MGLFFTILHVVLCIILILIILLQPSKGSDVGAAFGGGSSSSMFGPRGAGSMLSRATTVVAILFMFTSITRALRSTPEKLSGDDLENGVLGGGLEDIDLGIDDPKATGDDKETQIDNNAEEAAIPPPHLDSPPEAETSISTPQPAEEPAVGE